MPQIKKEPHILTEEEAARIYDWLRDLRITILKSEWYYPLCWSGGNPNILLELDRELERIGDFLSEDHPAKQDGGC